MNENKSIWTRIKDGVRIMFLIVMGSRETAIREYGLEGVISYK